MSVTTGGEHFFYWIQIWNFCVYIMRGCVLCCAYFFYRGLTLIRIPCCATTNTLIDCDQWCVYILVTHDWRIVGIDTWSTCNKKWILNTISPFWTKYIIIAATHLTKFVQNRVWILLFQRRHSFSTTFVNKWQAYRIHWINVWPHFWNLVIPPWHEPLNTGKRMGAKSALWLLMPWC